MDHIDALARSLRDHGRANIGYELPKDRAAEIENGLHTIDADVIMEEFIACQTRQLGAYRQFSRRRWSVNDYQFHRGSPRSTPFLRVALFMKTK
jgi:hypothetical protein